MAPITLNQEDYDFIQEVCFGMEYKRRVAELVSIPFGNLSFPTKVYLLQNFKAWGQRMDAYCNGPNGAWARMLRIPACQNKWSAINI
jgi:hypothetical protein